MPQVFKVGSYWVYFWSNENKPLEPIHVHVAQGSPSANSAKIWITKTGKCLLCSNDTKIPKRILKNVMRVMRHEVMKLSRNGLIILVRFVIFVNYKYHFGDLTKMIHK